MAKVSVVMSCYNNERELAEAIESVLNQQDIDLEFIIVNDGSTDSSKEILDRYAAKDKRIKLIHQQNTGLTKALIHGCGLASGEFIARQDSDDISLPGRLQKQVTLLESDPRFVFVSCFARELGPGGETLNEITRSGSSEEISACMFEKKLGLPGHGTAMIKKSAFEKVGGYRECFYYAQDGDLWFRLLGQGLLAYVPEILYAYRQRPGGISMRNSNLQASFGKLARECHLARLAGESEKGFLLQAHELRDQLITEKKSGGNNRNEAAGLYLIASGLEKKGDPQASRYFLQAVKKNPLFFKAYVRYALNLVRKKS